MMRIANDRVVNSTADNKWIDVQQTSGNMERTLDEEATLTCGKHVKKLITRQFGKNCKPAKFKLKQSNNDRGRFKIKLNDGSINHTLKLSVDFKNSTVDMEYDNFKRQNSMTTWKRHSACGIKKKNESRPVSIEVQTENPDVQSPDEVQSQNKIVQTQTGVCIESSAKQRQIEPYTEIKNNVAVSNEVNLSITEIPNQNEISTDTEQQLANGDHTFPISTDTEEKLSNGDHTFLISTDTKQQLSNGGHTFPISTDTEQQLSNAYNTFQISTDTEQQLETDACLTIGNNPFRLTKLRCERKESEKQYGSTVLVGTPERWFTLNAAVPTYTNSEHNGTSSLFVNIKRTSEHDSAIFWHPVDNLKNDKIVELCYGELNKTNTRISADQLKNLDDVSTKTSLSTNSCNQLSDQNKSENKRTTPVQNRLTASNYSQTSEKKSEIKFEQAQAIQEEGCQRKKVTSKVKGQTRHVPQKPLYIITTQDEEVVRQLLSDFPLHDFVRKETNNFFRNEQKMHFTRPSVPIPSMHPLLPYKLRYLDEVEPSEHHVIETSSAPTEPESQDSDLNEKEYFF